MKKSKPADELSEAKLKRSKRSSDRAGKPAAKTVSVPRPESVVSAKQASETVTPLPRQALEATEPRASVRKGSAEDPVAAVDAEATIANPSTTPMGAIALSSGSSSASDAKGTQISEAPGFASSAKVINFGEGLYAITVGAAPPKSRTLNVFRMPATHVIPIVTSSSQSARIQETRSAPNGWIGPDGGTLVTEVPPNGGYLVLTTFRSAWQAAVPLQIQISRLDRPLERRGMTEPGIRLEINVHVEKQGSRRAAEGKWAGAPGDKCRIEAFEIRPLEAINIEHIEYKALGPSGRATAWKNGGDLCGAVGRGIPITVRYEGSYFEGGVEKAEDGAFCQSTRPDDALEAMLVSIVRKSAA